PRRKTRLAALSGWRGGLPGGAALGDERSTMNISRPSATSGKNQQDAPRPGLFNGAVFIFAYGE
ncbi:hypothetical protein, partial [Pseudomonas sp. 43(2021)]|uniref:hypothetical protein n=1 Tax=Pseudomonas sp. 43(2021) TaxID=2813560 RepID=UPI001A9DB4D0